MTTIDPAAQWEEVAAQPPQVQRERFGNVMVEWKEVKTKDGEAKSVEVTTYRRVDDIGRGLRHITGGWPKSVGGLPFVVRPVKAGEIPTPGCVRALNRTADVFAWIGEVTEPYWTEKACYAAEGGKRTPPTKDEFFAHIRQSGDRVDAVSCLPHEPPIPGVFYVPCTLPEATGERLAEFLARLNPETETDRQLLLAMILTMFWGGPCGARPAFVLRSRHGKGSGKTSTAVAIMDIAGGHFDIDPKEEWDRVSRRIMADDAMQQRAAFVDNVRGKLDSSYLEALVTAKKITGWRMYFGNFTRPNYTTLIITSNTPKLSHDLSVRSVIIDIGRQRHTEGFVSWVDGFVDKYRAELVADALAMLKAPPQSAISPQNRDRFMAWQDGVLTRLPGADWLAGTIKERRASTDADAETVETVAKAIASWLRSKNLDPGRREPIKISRDEMYALLKNAGALPSPDMNKNGLHSWLTGMLGTDGCLAPLTDSSSRANGRVWLWSGELWVSPDDSDLPPV